MCVTSSVSNPVCVAYNIYDKRKLDGTVDESSAEQQIHIIVKYLEAYTYQNQVSWHAGRHAGWQADKIQTCFGSKYFLLFWPSLMP